MINVLLVDDHALVRAGIKRVLEECDGIKVVAEASDGNQALKEYENVQSDVVIMDISMPVMDGLDATKMLIGKHPEAHILVLTMYPEQHYATRILKTGALGYVTKGTSTKELHDAVNTVAMGKRFLSEAGKDTVISQFLGTEANLSSVELLSDRELQVLCLLARGNKMKEIADDLGLSSRTIETYRSRIMAKLHLRGNADIVSFALQNGLIQS